ncbi:hypothetical protein BGZ73_000133, partial [Actinomortierella ambigua]
MGRPVGRNLEEEMIVKIKRLFDKVLDSVNKENPNYCFDFEQFVDCFDENDHFTKRVFEFLVKETAQRYRASHPQNQLPMPRPPVIHHYLQETLVDTPSSADNASGTSSSINDSSASLPALASGSSGTLFQQLQQSSGLSSSPPSVATVGISSSLGGHSTSPGLHPTTTSFGALRSLLASQNSRRRHVQRMLNDEHYAQQYRHAANTATSGRSPRSSDLLGTFETRRIYTWGDQPHSPDPNSDSTMVHATSLMRPRPRRPLERSNAIVIRPYVGTLERSMEQMGEHGFSSFGGAAEALMNLRAPANEVSGTAARTIGPTLTERRLARLARATEVMRAAALRAQSQPPSAQSSHGSSLQQPQQHQSAHSSPFMTVHSALHTPPPQVSRPTADDIREPQSRYLRPSAHDSSLAETETEAGASGSATVRPHHLEAAYEEFQARTARERSAMRESVIAAAEAADSIAASSPEGGQADAMTTGGEGDDEYHQISLPGIGLALPNYSEGGLSPALSRRRRRSRPRPVLNPMDSPDIASDNSSAIISQAAQHFANSPG